MTTPSHTPRLRSWRLTKFRPLRCELLEDRRMLSATLFVDADAPTGGDGLAWATAYQDLQEALDTAAAFNGDAVATNDVEAIWIAEGVYLPSKELEPGYARSASFSLVDGVTLFGGFVGMESALSERDWNSHETVLSGDLGAADDVADNAYTVVYCGEGVTAGVDGVTITEGKADGRYSVDHPENIYGAGIYNLGAIAVTNSRLCECKAATNGGAIYNGSTGNLVVSNGVIVQNSAGTSGGGVANYHGNLTIAGSTVVGNSSPRHGAGVYSQASSFTLTNSIVALNEGEDVVGATSADSSNNVVNFDPKFVRNPGVNGPDDQGDLRLTVDSPAIDSGDPIRLSSDVHDIDGDGNTLEPLPLDHAGHPRVFGASLDIGAYECQSEPTGNRETPSTIVNTATDMVDLHDGQISLREAIYYAHLGVVERLITFAPELSGATILLDSSSLPIMSTLSIDASSLADGVTISGGDRGRAFNVSGLDVELTNLTITKGFAVDGGGICNFGTLVISKSTFSENTARGQYYSSGGAIYNAGALTLVNSVLSENASISDNYRAGGGGVFNYFGTLTIEDGSFSENSATDNGGAVYNYDGTTIVANSTFLGNLAGFEGGAFLNYGELMVTGSTLSGNSAENDGGAILNHFADLIIEDSVLSANCAHRYGGAIDNAAGSIVVKTSILSENLAKSGGGGAISSGTGPLTVTHSVLSANSTGGRGGGILGSTKLTVADSALVGNSAVDRGGGIHISGGPSSHVATIVNTTLTANVAQTGGGISSHDSSTTAKLSNTIVAGNTASNRPDVYRRDTALLGSHNLIGDGSDQTDFIHGQNGNLVGTASTPIDPRFIRNPSDGGDGWGDDPDTPDVDESLNDDYGDLRLRADSPAIDAGDNGLLPADTFDLDGDGDTAEPIPVDLAGGVRVRDGDDDGTATVDMGAYEYVMPGEIVEGDLNGDGMVGGADLDLVRAYWGQSVPAGNLTMGDPSGDGAVGGDDLDIVRANWGQAVPSAAVESRPEGESQVSARLGSGDAVVYGPMKANSPAAVDAVFSNLHALAEAAWRDAVEGLRRRS